MVMTMSLPPVMGAVSISEWPPSSSPRAVTVKVRSPRLTEVVGTTEAETLKGPENQLMGWRRRFICARCKRIAGATPMSSATGIRIHSFVFMGFWQAISLPIWPGPWSFYILVKQEVGQTIASCRLSPGA